MSTPSTIALEGAGSTATLTPFGAHLLSFSPAGSRPVLWMSESAVLDGSKAIRGGVPVCLPWFANPATSRASFVDPSGPHGVARTALWEVVAQSRAAATLELRHRREDAGGVFPHAFTARLSVAVSERLDLSLEIANEDDHAFLADAALHTYLTVSDVRSVALLGLAGARAVDTPSGAECTLPDRLAFTGPTDLVCDSEATAVLEDPGWGRRIVVEKSGSRSTIVWNPWDEGAAALSDVEDAAWPGFLCVESANVRDRAWRIGAGESAGFSVSIRTEEL